MNAHRARVEGSTPAFVTNLFVSIRGLSNQRSSAVEFFLIHRHFFVDLLKN